MKKIKYIVIGIVIGIVIVGSISVYAVTAIIESNEVSYDNKNSHGSHEDVQGSIDELYERSGVMKTKWVDPILNGADPVLGEGMIPVKIDDDGTVHYANLYTKWYEYETKKWANAVILTDDGKKKDFKTGDKIDEEYIESYFVWIPRYKYKIWNLGKYDKVYIMGNLTDTKEDADNDQTSLRNITGKTRLVDIEFGDTKTVQKMEETSATLNEYYTHPAFSLGEKELNGIWVGKFETGYKGATTRIDAQKNEINSDKIIIKPNAYSWRGITVGNIFKNALEYESSLGSHMMKNTEWGAVAYLSHSVYGIGNEININNNSEYKTGYSAAANTDQSTYPGTSGTGTNVTQPWNTPTGYLASTTGNITGVYDMSGGAYEYVAAYMNGYEGKVSSDLSASDLTTYAKYLDKYSASSTVTSYNQRIMGDATGETGPFYLYFDKDGVQRNHNAWYDDYSDFVGSTNSWFYRGGYYADGVLAGQFNFGSYTGGVNGGFGSHLVLAI